MKNHFDAYHINSIRKSAYKFCVKFDKLHIVQFNFSDHVTAFDQFIKEMTKHNIPYYTFFNILDAFINNKYDNQVYKIIILFRSYNSI